MQTKKIKDKGANLAIKFYVSYMYSKYLLKQPKN